MCLRVDLRDKFINKGLKVNQANLIKIAVQKAKKDIQVYKRFIDSTIGLVTPYKNLYWPGRTLVSIPKLGILLDPDYSGRYCLKVNEGLHAYTSEEKARNCKYGDAEVIRKMVIPKGASYISNDYGEIIATDMRMGRIPNKDDRPKRKPAKTSKRKLVSKRKKK